MSLSERIRLTAGIEMGVAFSSFTTPLGVVIKHLCDHVEKAVADLSERIDGLARVRSEQDARLRKRIEQLARASEERDEKHARRAVLQEDRLDAHADRLCLLETQYAEACGVKVATAAGPIEAGDFVALQRVAFSGPRGPEGGWGATGPTATQPTYIPREYVKRADVVGLDCDGAALCVGDEVTAPSFLESTRKWTVAERSVYPRRVIVRSARGFATAPCEYSPLDRELKLKAP